MSDMLSMISAEPAAAFVADRPVAHTTSNKSFEQILQEGKAAIDQTEDAEQQLEVAVDSEDLALEEAQLDEIGPIDPQAVTAEPLPTFSVGHAALQLSMEALPPAQPLPDLSISVDDATVLPTDQIADLPLHPAAMTVEPEIESEPDQSVATDGLDIVPPMAVETTDASTKSQTGNPVIPAAPSQPLQQDPDAHRPVAALDAPITEAVKDSPITQAPKLDATAAPMADTMAAQSLPPDEFQAAPSVMQAQAKEPAAFDKLLAQGPVGAPAAEDKAPASPLVRNILDRMQELEVSEGKTRILLRPQGMGALEIDILRQADGRIHLAIKVENPMVLDALRNESSALSSFMGEKGFDLSNGGPDLSSYRRPTQGDEDIGTDEPDAEATVIETALLDGERVNILT